MEEKEKKLEEFEEKVECIICHEFKQNAIYVDGAGYVCPKCYLEAYGDQFGRRQNIKW